MKNKILNQTKKSGPYEKFLEKGAEYLEDAELLAIILRTGTVGEDTVSIARKVLDLPGERQKGILGLHYVSLKELMSIRGIGQVKAIKLKCLAELSTRISQASAKEVIRFDNPKLIVDYYMEKLRHKQREQVVLLMLDNRSHLIGDCYISEGTINSSLVSPREILITALQKGAVYLILVHNHPGGDPSPSENDNLITVRMKNAGLLIGIPLIDHIIIGDHKYYSYKEMGLL